MILAAMEEAIPYCKLLFSTAGNLDSFESLDPSPGISSPDITSPDITSPDIMVKNTSKVIIFNQRKVE